MLLRPFAWLWAWLSATLAREDQELADACTHVDVGMCVDCEIEVFEACVW